MDFSSVFRTHDFLEDAAISYGFRKKGGVFTLERALPETDGLAAVVTCPWQGNDGVGGGAAGPCAVCAFRGGVGGRGFRRPRA